MNTIKNNSTSWAKAKFMGLFFPRGRKRQVCVLLCVFLAAVGAKNICVVIVGDYLGLRLSMVFSPVETAVWIAACAYLIAQAFIGRNDALKSVPTGKPTNLDSAAKLSISRAA